jgi:peroxiredoxin
MSIPGVPLTLDGAFVLHQMFRVRWQAWKGLEAPRRAEIVAEAESLFRETEREHPGQTALFSLLGHKGDLLLLHFRHAPEALNAWELDLARAALADFLEPTGSYVSVVELGLYELSARLYRELQERGIAPGSAEWKRTIEAALAEQERAAAPRLWPRVPPRRYVCFYPMSKRRGEEKNWYRAPLGERQRLMQEHGAIGRRYAGQVTQIISGSIGFDDWEWGVDLFADDPLVFKRLVYEMRFDEASAVYALFGPFYVGVRLEWGKLGQWLDGRLPA